MAPGPEGSASQLAAVVELDEALAAAEKLAARRGRANPGKRAAGSINTGQLGSAMSNPHRVTAGVPTGGQFASTSRPESEVELEVLVPAYRMVCASSSVICVGEADDVVANRADGGLISDATARTIADWYQYSRDGAAPMEQMARTGRVDRADLADAIAAIRSEDASQETWDYMDALQRWAEQTPDAPAVDVSTPRGRVAARRQVAELREQGEDDAADRIELAALAYEIVRLYPEATHLTAAVSDDSVTVSAVNFRRDTSLGGGWHCPTQPQQTQDRTDPMSRLARIAGRPGGLFESMRQMHQPSGWNVVSMAELSTLSGGAGLDLT